MGIWVRLRATGYRLHIALTVPRPAGPAIRRPAGSRPEPTRSGGTALRGRHTAVAGGSACRVATAGVDRGTAYSRRDRGEESLNTLDE